MNKTDKSFSELTRAMELSQGRFALIKVRCNYKSLEKRIIQGLHDKYPNQIANIEISPKTQNLYQTISEKIQDTTPIAVTITHRNRYFNPEILSHANSLREKFQNFKIPILFFVNDRISAELNRIAPDFNNWMRSLVCFEFSDDELLHIVQNAISSDMLDDNELESFLKDIKAQEPHLTPEETAHLHFLSGKNAEYQEQTDSAIEHYQKSLSFWEEKDDAEKQEILIYHLANCYSQRKQWEELKKLASKISEFIRNCSNTIRCAECQRFLAEIASADRDWDTSEQLIRDALKTLLPSPSDNILIIKEDIPEIVRHLLHCIEHFKNQKSKPDIKFYVGILELLREIYFEKGRYLESFRVKQEKHSLEQQYGLRAFIGAGRLKPRFYSDFNETNVSEEIEASGRKEDVNLLMEKIKLHDNHLIIFHGDSGVGKSSILEAGLKPALKEKGIGFYKAVIPVVIRTYEDWDKIIGHYMTQELQELNCEVSSALDSPEQILTELDKIKEDFLTVLIFDQFEEFFFLYHKPEMRKPFYAFLDECLKPSYAVRIIFSLREDYLHYLLEYERIANFDLLTKNFRIYLGNFTIEGARDVIKSLTRRAHFMLDDDLIDKIVADLAQGAEEVRPIELQIVGSRVQADNINTVEKYNLKPKEKLVGEFIQEAIRDCGKENEDIAQLILYLLTDEKNTRPLKTRAELENELKNSGLENVKDDQLDLVLKVLEGSGLIFLVIGESANRYQLVHDYLVEFIRKGHGKNLVTELKAERAKRIKAEKRLLNFVFVVGFLILVFLTSFIIREKMNFQQIEQLNQRIASISLTTFEPIDGFEKVKNNVQEKMGYTEEQAVRFLKYIYDTRQSQVLHEA